MNEGAVIGWLCVSWALVSFVFRTLELLALQRHASRTHAPAQPPAGGKPAVLALWRPLCGAPPYLGDCLASLFAAADAAASRLAAPVPVRLAIEDGEDPAHTIVEHVRSAFPGVPSELRTGKAGPGRNRKVANLLQLDAGERADVIVLSDDDIHVPADYATHIALAFADESIGFATAAYRSVPAASVASRCDALLHNLYFLPNTCFGAALEGLNFGLGSTLAIRRAALAEAGGLEAVVDDAADDARLAERIHSLGWHGRWLEMIVEHRLADVGWRAALGRHLRCARATRSMRPAGAVGLIVVTHGWLPAAVAGALFGPAPAIGALVGCTAWWSARLPVLWPLRRVLGLRAGDAALGPLLDGVTLCIQLVALGGRATPPTRAPASGARA